MIQPDDYAEFADQCLERDFADLSLPELLEQVRAEYVIPTCQKNGANPDKVMEMFAGAFVFARPIFTEGFHKGVLTGIQICGDIEKKFSNENKAKKEGSL